MGQIISSLSRCLFQEENESGKRSQHQIHQETTHAELRSTYGAVHSSFSRSGYQRSQDRKVRSQDRKIKLYHYTTVKGARGIKREMLIRSSNKDTQPQHRRYGQGVYFTSYSPHDLEPDKLALNIFTHRGTVVMSPGIYHRTRFVIEIEFDAHKVEKINVPDRSVYIHRGSINLNDYQGRYRIYKNPVNPFNNEGYSDYLDNIGL